jgi:hypothetical protein
MASISLSYNLLDCWYWEIIDETDDLDANDIFEEYLQPRFGDKTIFHLYATEVEILQLMLDEVRKSDTESLK